MDDILVTKRIGANRTICLSTLSQNQLAEVPEYRGDHFGYFIYEMDHSSRKGGIVVLARVLSYEAAIRILQVLEKAFGIVADDMIEH